MQRLSRRGLITGAADDDPSGIATYSTAGALLGTGQLWTALITWPLMASVQMMCARIGMVTGKGLAGALHHKFPRPLIVIAALALLAANTINIGADLAAMGAATQLAVGGSTHLYTVGFALLSLILQLFIPYARYANYLKWLTLVLLAYVGVVFSVTINWTNVGAGTYSLTATATDALGGSTTSAPTAWSSSARSSRSTTTTTSRRRCSSPARGIRFTSSKRRAWAPTS